jgi:hypothetical protein
VIITHSYLKLKLKTVCKELTFTRLVGKLHCRYIEKRVRVVGATHPNLR